MQEQCAGIRPDRALQRTTKPKPTLKRPRHAWSRHISPGAALQSPAEPPRTATSFRSEHGTGSYQHLHKRSGSAHHTQNRRRVMHRAPSPALQLARLPCTPARGLSPAPGCSQNRRLPAFNRIKAEPAAARNSRTHPQIEPGSTTVVPAALTFCTRASWPPLCLHSPRLVTTLTRGCSEFVFWFLARFSEILSALFLSFPSK